jgi:hypothetical protein
MGRTALRKHRHLVKAVDMHLLQIDWEVEQSLEVTRRASAAADVRHESNRKRRAAARDFYSSRTWPTTAAAVAAIAKEFHSAPKTVERWISIWNKE